MTRRASTINIDRALLDPHLLGAAIGNPDSWSIWLAILRAAFALAMSDEDLAAFTKVAGDRKPPRKRVRELWCLIGRRSGKSRIAAALAVFIACFVKHHLARGEVGTVLVLAASQARAKVVFDYCLGYLTASPVLKSEIASTTTTEIRLRNGNVIAVHPNSYRTVRGKTLLCAIFDEVAIWRDADSALPDIETYRAVLPSLVTTNGMLIGISSPYRKTGLLYQKHRDHFGQDSDDVLVVQAPSRVFNPTLDEQIIAAAISADPEAAIAEWEGEFRSDISSFLGDEIIERAVDYSRPLEIPPRAGTHYRAFTDASGGRHDHYTLAIAHKNKDHLIVDVVRGAGPPFDPQQVSEQFAALCKEYHLAEVVGDNYSAEWMQAAWIKCGLRYRRADKNKSQLYVESLPLWTRGLISIPDHPRLLRELRLLERQTHRSGRDTVDQGRNGSDDYANALCGVITSLALQSNYMDRISRAFALTDDDHTEDRRSLADRNLAQVYKTFAGGVRPI